MAATPTTRVTWKHEGEVGGEPFGAVLVEKDVMARPPQNALRDYTDRGLVLH